MTSKIFLGASSRRSTKGLLLLVDYCHLENLIKGYFNYYHWQSNIKTKKNKYSQAWAICNCSWSFDFSSWSFDLSSSRLLICRFTSQSSIWCFRFASYSLFRAARDSSSHLAIRAFCCSRVFRLSIVLYKAWDFKKDRLATSCNIQGKTG